MRCMPYTENAEPHARVCFTWRRSVCAFLCDFCLQFSLLHLLQKTQGIFILRAEVLDAEGNKVFHFYGLDAWRKLIYDNDKDPSVRYCQWDASDMASEDSAKALFKQLGLVQLLEVYSVMVLASRARETKFFGEV